MASVPLLLLLDQLTAVPLTFHVAFIDVGRCISTGERQAQYQPPGSPQGSHLEAVVNPIMLEVHFDGCPKIVVGCCRSLIDRQLLHKRDAHKYTDTDR